MEKSKKIVPAITVNGKEYCINVGRDVVRALDYPSHICILEHDRWQVMAITPCDESDPLSFRVPEGFPDEKMKKFRIYSQSLVREILADCDLNPGEVYNLKGEYIDAMNAVLFRLDTAEGSEEQ